MNYIALGGQLGANGLPGSKPAIPLSVVDDIAGGGFLSAFCIVQALYARESTGGGQHLDIAMSDSVLYLMTWHPGRVPAGQAAPMRGQHTSHVLLSLGYDNKQIVNLLQQGVVS